MTRKTLYADDVKAAIEKVRVRILRQSCDDNASMDRFKKEAANIVLDWTLAAIDSLPAAEPKALLDPDEVKAVLAEALAPQPMAKVWVEAAINAMCGKVVGEPDAGERVERPPMLLASVGDGSRDVWWTRQGDDLWESQRIFGVATHAGSKSLIVDRTASDEAALNLYDSDLAASRHSERAE